jgi:hypothetical protein
VEIARRHLTLMFDAAMRLGVRMGADDRRFGRAEVFSFHATKFSLPKGATPPTMTNWPPDPPDEELRLPASTT